MKIIFLLTVLIVQAAYAKPEVLKDTCVQYPVGNNRALKSGSREFIVQSPDGQSVVTKAYVSGAIQLVNLSTGQETTIASDPWIKMIAFSPDSQSVVTAGESNATARVTNLITGKTTVIHHKNSVNSAYFSPDGQSIVTASDDETVKVSNLTTGKELEIKCPTWPTSAKFSPDGKHLLVRYHYLVEVLDLGTMQTSRIDETGISGITSASFSPDSQSIVTASGEHQAIVTDLISGKKTPIGDGSVNMASFSPDGQSVITADGFGITKVINLKTGQKSLLTHNPGIRSVSFSPDSQSVVILDGGGELNLDNLATHQGQTLPGEYQSASFTPDGRGLLYTSTDGKIGTASLERVCVHDQIKIENTPAACITGPNATPANVGVTDSMQTLLCSEKWSPDLAKQWDSLSPNENPLTKAHGRALLLRFQKPGGFDPERHLPALLAILRSDLPKQEPDLVLGTLQNVLHTSNALYEKLLLDFPDLLRLKTSNNPRPTCRTSDEDAGVLSSATQYLHFLRNKNKDRTKYADWMNLLPLSSILSKLTDAQKEEYRDDLAQRMADGAADTRDYSNVFLSKLYKFTYEATAPLFGENPKPLSDLTVTRSKDGLSPIILGTVPIDNDLNSKTEYGFSAKSLPSILVLTDRLLWNSEYQNNGGKIHWAQGDQHFEAEISAELLAKNGSLIPQGDGPDYKSLWQDGSLNGVVITGTNLKGLSADVLQEYLAYYQGQGFVFDEPTKEPDLKQFLKNQVTSGKMDYFIKEAHSDGDEKNLFRMDHSAMIRTGTLTRPDKTKETITLVYPDGANDKTELLPNQEFGEWVREREKAKQGQLVYFNTSCWSHAKAVHEIEAAHSSTLLDIPSLTMMQTFSNSPESAERLMFDAFRNGRNYEAMRTELSKNELNKAGKENVVLFPDDQGYRDHISDLLATPVDTKITITRDGQPYNIDEVQH